MSQKSWLAIFIAAMFLITPLASSINNTSNEGFEQDYDSESEQNNHPDPEHTWDIEFAESPDGVEIWASPHGESFPVGEGLLEWTYLSHSNQKIEGDTSVTLTPTTGVKITTISELPYGVGQLRAWLVIDEVVAEFITELNVESGQISIIDPNQNTQGEFYQIAKQELPPQPSAIGTTSPIPELVSNFAPLSTSDTNGRSTLQITYDADSITYPWSVAFSTANNTSALGWAPSNFTYTEGSGSLWSSGYDYTNNTSQSCTILSCGYANNMYTGVYAPLSLGSYANATDLDLTFDVNYSLETGYDFFQVYAATNSSSWTLVGNYTGSSSGWTTETIDLLNYSGHQNFTLYFLTITDFTVTSGHGVFIDDILISGNTSTHSDLVADGVWAPSTTTAGNSYSASAAISNIGNTATGTFYLSLFLYNSTTSNYTSIKDYNINSYNANTSTNNTYNLTIPSTISPGTYTWVSYVDSYQNVTESNESNNVVFGNSMTISSSTPSGGNIDIIADYIGNSLNSTSSFCAGNTINVQRAFSTNPSTTTSFEYAIYLSTNNIISTGDTQIYNFSSSWSSSNTTIGLTIPSSISTGNYYLGLIVDPSNSVNESSETNNYVASNTTISINNSPDLEAISVSGPSATTPGSSVSISRDFKNSGCSSTSGFRYGVYLSTNNVISTGDILVSNRSFGSLSAGSTNSQSVTFTLSSSISTGTYYWGIILDPYNVVSESNENNNYKAATSTSTVTGSGYVTVTAKFQYYNYYLANNSACSSTCYSNVKYAKAELWDQDTVSSDDLLGTSYLDAYGNVKFSNIGVSEVGTNQDIYIKLYSTNSAAEVSSSVGSTNAKGSVYTWSTSVVTNVASGVYSYGTQSISNNGAALNIMTTLLDSRSYSNNYGSSNIAQLDSRWPRSDGSTGAYYWTNGGSHIVLYDGFDATVNFHEYAHYVEDYYTSHTGGGGAHSFNSCTSEDLGWSEGWASYFAIAVKNRYNYLNDTWYKNWYEYEEGLFSGGYRNYDANGYATVNNPSNGTHWDCLEEVVTGIMWDIHDGLDDDSWDTDGFGDTLGNWNRQYAQEIWDAALDYNPNHDFTLADFTYYLMNDNPSFKEQYFDILVDHAIRPELSCSSSYDDASEAGSSGDAGSTISTSKSLWINASDEIFTYHGCLTTSTDNQDYYSVTIPSGKELKAVLVSPGNNDFDISILNSTNSYLAGSSNSLGMEWANWSSYSSSSQTVYVVIDRHTGSGSMYGLTIELVNKTNPNLVANWIGAPSLIHAGSTITATIAMSNTGGDSGPFNYGIYLSTDGNITPSDTRLYSGYYSSYCGNCQSNLSVSVSIPSSLTTGSTYYWGLYVDYGYAVSETSGSDNDYTGVQTTVGCGITQNDGGWGGDFANNISASNWTGYIPTMTLSGCMDNNDTVDYLVLGLDSGYDVDVRLTDTNLSDFDIELMYYSNSTSIDQSTSGNNIDWVSTLGTNASGNNAFLVIKIYRFSGAGGYNLDIWSNATYLSDLEPTYLYGPDWANPGQPVYVWREITNNGKLYSGQFNYSIYLSSDTTITTSDYLVDNFTQWGISYMSWNYTNVSFTIPNSIPTGTYYWGVIVDGANTITEDNESNNALYGNEVEILACNYQQDDLGQGVDAPDYGLTSLSITTGTNSGCLNIFDTEDSYTITTGANTRLEISMTPPLGNDFDVAVVDSYGQAWFGNTSSNTKLINMTSIQGETFTIVVWNSNYEGGGDYSLTINVVQLADVTISSITAPNNAQAGSTLNINMAIENIGSEQTSQFSVETYLSRDHFIDSSDILIDTSQKGIIYSGQQSQHNLNIALDNQIAEGPYYLCISLNPDKTMDESQYWNNWECTGIYVETPDLTTPVFVTQTDLITNQSTYTVEWSQSTSASIPVSGYYLMVNGQTSQLNSATTSMIGLVEGSNSISVYAVNSVGSISESDHISIILDTVAPLLPELPFTALTIGKPGTFSINEPHCMDDIAIASTWISIGNEWTIISSGGITDSFDPGVTVVEFRCQDVAGNYGPIGTIEVTTDLDSPDAPTIDGPNGWVSAGNHAFSVTQTRDVGTGVSATQYSINGGEWRMIIDDSIELHFATGNHSLSFRSIDFAENIGESTIIELYVDNTMPEAPIIEIGQYYQSTSQILANLSITSNEHSFYTWSLDGGQENIENSSVIDLGQLDEGFYVLAVISWDQVGNPSEKAQVQFIVDDSPPNAPLIYCSSSWHTSNVVSCSVEAPYDTGSGISHLQKQVNDEPWESIDLADIEQGTLNMQLDDGEHEISFRWVDLLGQNSEITTHSILVDTTPPEMIILQNGIIDLYVADGSTKVIIANLTIDVTENGSGLAAILYSFDGGETWYYYSSEGGIVAPNGMTGQQIVKFMILDYAGNQETSTETINFAGDDPDLIVEEPAGIFGDTNSALIYGGGLFVILFGLAMAVLYRKN